MAENTFSLHAAKWFRLQRRKEGAPGRLWLGRSRCSFIKRRDAYIAGACAFRYFVKYTGLLYMPCYFGKAADMEESNEKKPKNKPGAQPPHDLHRHKAPRADLGLRLSGFVVRKRTAPLHTIQHHSIRILSITPSRYISYLSLRVPGLLLTDNPQSSTYTMAWQPSEQGLQEVLGMLRDTSSVDSEVQRNVAQRLEQLRFVPDFLAYLAHVLIHCTGEQDSHRAVAGLLLKNSLNQRSGPTTNENDARAMAYVKNTVLTGLADPDQIVRQTVGTVIMCLISNEDVGAWPEALDALTKGMGSTDPNVVEVCAARPFYCGRASSNS